MQRFIDLVKKHPLWILGGVLGLVIIWYLSSSGSDESAPMGVINIGPTAETVMANRDITIAQMANQRAGAQDQIAVALAGIQSSTMITLDEGARYTAERLAGIEAGSYDTFLNTTKAITEIQADRDITIVGKQVDGGVNLAGIASNTATTTAQIQSNTSNAINNADNQAAYNLWAQEAHIAARATEWANISAALTSSNPDEVAAGKAARDAAAAAGRVYN